MGVAAACPVRTPFIIERVVQFCESRTYVFMTRLIIRLSPETPTPDPPSPREGGSGGMGLPTKSAKDLCKAVTITVQIIIRGLGS